MSLLKICRTYKTSFTLIIGLVLFGLMSNVFLVEAQVAAPKINCAVVSEAGGQVTVEVTVDTGGDSIDSVRMEMLYPNSALSNPNLTLGDDFDTPAPGGESDLGDGNTLLVQTYGRSESIGPITGDALAFATIVFDWTGESTTLSFNPTGSGIGQGSLQLLVGDRTTLNVESCSVGGDPLTVFDQIAASAIHSILEQALIAAGLDSVLDDETATYTVFAPNDATLTANGLSAEDLISDILLRHVILGAAEMSTDITNGETYSAQGGNTLTADTTDGVTVDGLVPDLLGEVTLADITADNGVVHSIDFSSAAPQVTATPEPPATVTGSISCTILEGTGQVVVDVMVDTGGLSTDSVRMEMIYESAALSNPALVIGDDFDTPAPGGEIDLGDGNTLLVQTYGRSESIGPIVGEALDFASITFDWSGDATEVSFNPVGSGTGQGSFQLLVGDTAPLGVETCSVIVDGSTPTPVPTDPPATPTPVPTESPATVTGSISCTILEGTGQVVVDVMVDTGGLSTDSVRMEMIYESAALSNPALVIGDDFDTPAPGGEIDLGDGNTLLVQTYGRSESIGPIVGEALDFASITFDWSGDATEVSFNPVGSGTGQGSFQLLVGDTAPLGVETCSVIVDGSTPTPVPTDPPATPTPVPTEPPATPTPVPTEPPATVTGSISCTILEGTGQVVVDVMVDTGGLNTDSVRMEMIYESAALSNPALVIGDDFDTPAPGGEIDLGDGNTLLVQTYGRSESIGPIAGDALAFASITFDWAGGNTEVSFNPVGAGTGQGSFQLLVGDSAPLGVESCSVEEAPIILPATISGTVTEEDAPKPGILVTLIDDSGEEYESMLTDEQGNYLFTVPITDVEKDYTLVYLLPGFEVSGTVFAADPDSIAGTMTLTPVENPDATTTVTTSESITVPSAGAIENDVSYDRPPTSVGLSNIVIPERGGMFAMIAVILLTTSVVFVKTRSTYSS